MKILRIIILQGMIDNVRIFAKFVPGVNNKYSDWLSRDKIALFKRKTGNRFESHKTSAPEQIWPITKVWIKG